MHRLNQFADVHGYRIGIDPKFQTDTNVLLRNSIYNKQKILYRTKESMEKNRQKYNEIIERTALQKSQGIKGHTAPATFTSASKE